MSPSKRAPLLSLLLACALFCAGCAVADRELPPLLKTVREVQHPNGLSVGAPEGFDASLAPLGFSFSPVENRDNVLRKPVFASVSLVRNFQGGRPLSKTKTLGGRELRYRVIKDEGGSGGEHYRLTAYERVPGGFIQYEQSEQSETGEPDFALCWTLVSSTKFEQHKDNWKSFF